MYHRYSEQRNCREGTSQYATSHGAFETSRYPVRFSFLSENTPKIGGMLGRGQQPTPGLRGGGGDARARRLVEGGRRS